MRTFTESDWIENFRISRQTFVFICEKLRPSIERQNTRFRKSVSVEKRLAITLWCLATCAEYRSITHLFGVARCTVCVIVHDTCAAIVRVLLPHYIKFPVEDDLEFVINGFTEKWNMIQTVGAIDGRHIPVRPPTLNHTDYYNRKGWYSVILQAIVDHQYFFRDIYVGWPGSVHDARVLSKSHFYRKVMNKQLLHTHSQNINGKQVPPFLLGDSAYPLNTWLIKPYSQTASLTRAQHRLSHARIVVENAFGRLKARWRRLMKQNDMEITNVPNIIAACCVLHNMCEIHGDTFNEAWQGDPQLQDPPSPAPSTTPSSQAQSLRELLAQYLTIH